MDKLHSDWDYCLALEQTLQDLKTGKLTPGVALKLLAELAEVNQSYWHNFDLQVQVFLAALSTAVLTLPALFTVLPSSSNCKISRFS